MGERVAAPVGENYCRSEAAEQKVHCEQTRVPTAAAIKGALGRRRTYQVADRQGFTAPLMTKTSPLLPTDLKHPLVTSTPPVTARHRPARPPPLLLAALRRPIHFGYDALELRHAPRPRPLVSRILGRAESGRGASLIAETQTCTDSTPPPTLSSAPTQQTHAPFAQRRRLATASLPSSPVDSAPPPSASPPPASRHQPQPARIFATSPTRGLLCTPSLEVAPALLTFPAPRTRYGIDCSDRFWWKPLS